MVPSPEKRRLWELNASIQTKRAIIQRLKDEVAGEVEERQALNETLKARVPEKQSH